MARTPGVLSSTRRNSSSSTAMEDPRRRQASRARLYSYSGAEVGLTTIHASVWPSVICKWHPHHALGPTDDSGTSRSPSTTGQAPELTRDQFRHRRITTGFVGRIAVGERGDGHFLRRDHTQRQLDGRTPSKNVIALPCSSRPMTCGLAP